MLAMDFGGCPHDGSWKPPAQIPTVASGWSAAWRWPVLPVLPAGSQGHFMGCCWVFHEKYPTPGRPNLSETYSGKTLVFLVDDQMELFMGTSRNIVKAWYGIVHDSLFVFLRSWSEGLAHPHPIQDTMHIRQDPVLLLGQLSDQICQYMSVWFEL